MDDLLQEFIAETRETLEALSGEIVMWEADPADRARLDAIFRFVHTVKGSCGFLDLPRLSRLSHAAEDVLAAVRAGERAPDLHLVNAVLAIVDRIGDIIEAIDAGAALDDSGEDLLIAALDEGALSPVTGPSPNSLAVQRAPTRSVRLSVDLLDRMMSGMSDMVLARNELARRLRDGSVDPKVEAALERMSLTVAELRDTVTRTRMQKIDALFSALPRMVRDTSAELAKSVALTIEGADVELDREMIEMMRDPLVHIIRNAIDHGLETPAERRASGKRETGRLTVAARQSGNQIIIEIADDGRGIDVDRLLGKVLSSGVRTDADLRAMGDRAKLDLIFEPGLSTKDQVSAISGRGVGMDVVRANIEQIGGRIDLSNRPGRGLTILIQVPLTLSIISTIVIGAGGQRFALPRQSIEEIVPVRGDAIRLDMLGDTPLATVRGRRLPLVNLIQALGIADTKPPQPNMLVIVAINGGSYALAVDSVLDTEELVIKPAAPAVMASGFFAGQTLPDTGLPMLLLEGAGIAAGAGIQFNRELLPEQDWDEDSTVAPDSHRALLFRDLDGQRRAVPLSVVDRVELVAGNLVRVSAGALRLSIDGIILPLVARAPIEGEKEIAVVRLDDGDSQLGYVIGEALDIIDLADTLVRAKLPGPIAGVVPLDGEQIEVLDLHWLFAEHADPRNEANGVPVCLLTGNDTAWMNTFLRPVIEAAGYAVIAEAHPDITPAIALAMDDDPSSNVGTDVPVVRLCRRRNSRTARGNAVYRYDREALMSVLEAHRAAAGGQ